MTLINSSLLYIQNGEVADNVSLNRTSVQLLANDVNLDSRVTNVENTSSAVVSEIDTINDTLGELGTSVSGLEQTTGEIGTSVSNIEQAIEGLESDVSDLKNLTSETSNLTLASLTLKDPVTLKTVTLNSGNVNESIIQWF